MQLSGALNQATFQGQLLRYMEEAVIAFDLSRKITYWSHGAQRLFGYTENEVLGKPIDFFALSGRRRASSAEPFQAALDTGRWRGLYQHQRKDGSYLWIDTTLAPLKDDYRRIIGYVCVYRDITQEHEYKRQMEALTSLSIRLSRAKTHEQAYKTAGACLRDALAVTGAAILFYDEKQDQLKVTQKWGASSVTRSTFSSDQGITGLVFRSGRPMSLNGSKPNVSLQPGIEQGPLAKTCVALRADGQPIGVLWVSRETPMSGIELITLDMIANMFAGTLSRLTLLQQLKTQTTQMNGVMHAIDTGLVLLDKEQVVLMLNSAARCILSALGHPLEEGDRLMHINHCKVGELLTAAQAGNAACEMVVDGEAPRYVQIVVHTSDAADHCVLALRDVTRERMEQQFQQQQERLAAIGELAAGVAHDFNNYLAAIMLSSDTLARDPHVCERGRRKAESIYDQSQTASRLVAQILDFSRQTPMRKSVVDMDKVVAKAMAIMKGTLSSRVAVTVDVSGDCRVEGDATRLQQAIINLVANAHDAMPEGGNLNLTLRRVQTSEASAPDPQMKQGEWVEVAIRDNGTGIPASVLPRIFEPFLTTKPPGKGTGLGLSQTYGIVSQHDGYIQVRSVEGKGTTFYLYLPG